MNDKRIQDLIDEVLATSPQQWLLRLAVVMTPLGAVLAASAANGRWWPVGMFLVGGLGVLSAVRPDTSFALITVVVIWWHWLAAVDDMRTAWLPVAAVCALVFHTAVALLATLPSGGTLPLVTLGQWSRRVALGGCLTAAVWGLVVLMDRREAEGNGFLTALALAIVAAATVMIRSRSLAVGARRSQ